MTIPSPSTTVSATTPSRAFFARLGHVDLQRAAAELAIIEPLDRRLGFGVRRHLDKAEAAGAARVAVGDDGDGLDGSELGEGSLELRLRGVEGQIADVKLVLGHSCSRT